MSWERVVLEVMMRDSKIVQLQTSLTIIPKYVLCTLLIVLGCEVPDHIGSISGKQCFKGE